MSYETEELVFLSRSYQYFSDVEYFPDYYSYFLDIIDVLIFSDINMFFSVFLIRSRSFRA